MPFDAPVISTTLVLKIHLGTIDALSLPFAGAVSFPQPALTEGFLDAMLEVKHFAV